MADPEPKPALVYIRLSTEEQLKGDGERRQMELATSYAKKHGLELVTTFEGEPFKDIGRSGFKGEHIATGVFGRFLKAVKAGKMDGYTLLVESLDRISRQDLLDSIPMFIDILKGGVTVVSTTDGQVYSKETAGSNFMNVFSSGMVLGRANDESRTKKERLINTWAEKRRTDKKLTAQCPAWLKLMPILQVGQKRSQVESYFEPIPERVEIVRRIFHESAAGIGNRSIAARLNREGVKPFGRSNGWQPSYVAKILSNRAVLGEYQPCRISTKKGKGRQEGKDVKQRIEEGELKENYFPAIIDADLFERAQQARHLRKSDDGKWGRGGRDGSAEGTTGEHISNIFSGLATCYYCRSKMHYVQKGPGPKGGAYLRCDGAARGMSCLSTEGWRYKDFETTFLAFVRKLDLEPIVRMEDEAKARQALADEIQAMEGRLIDLNVRIRRLLDQVEAGEAVGDRLREREQEKSRLRDEINTKKAELDKRTAEANAFYESIDQIKSLIERLQDRSRPENYRLRKQISAKLRALVSDIKVAPAGDAPVHEVSDPTEDEEERLNRRFFIVMFKDGSSQVEYPVDKNPFAIREQYIIDADGSSDSSGPADVN
jgi:DNA invertase Pin-like site-specific DNA recombinase